MRTMKIRIYSDLHLEFLKQEQYPDFAPVDLVILAGDIHTCSKGVEWARRAFPDQQVVYVMGNHEYYGGSLEWNLADAKMEAANSNVHILEQEALELPDVTILGCTLWTDFLFNGADDENLCKSFSKRYMNDYRSIRYRGERLHPDDTQRISRACFAWLDQKIREATKPLIVVTHHGPSELQRNPDIAVDEYTPAYVSHYEALLRPPVKLWVTGHTHHCADIVHNGIRLITHQKGYPQSPVPEFDWDAVFDVSI